MYVESCMILVVVNRLSRPVVVLDRLPGLYGLKYDSATTCGVPLYLCSYKLVSSATCTRDPTSGIRAGYLVCTSPREVWSPREDPMLWSPSTLIQRTLGYNDNDSSELSASTASNSMLPQLEAIDVEKSQIEEERRRRRATRKEKREAREKKRKEQQRLEEKKARKERK